VPIGAPVPGAAAPPPAPRDGKKAWADVERVFAMAQAMAAFRMSELLGRPLEPRDVSAVQAAASAILQHAETQRLGYVDGMLPALLRRYQEQQARFGTVKAVAAATPGTPVPERERDPYGAADAGEEDDDLPF
jgi:hypothetical protein